VPVSRKRRGATRTTRRDDAVMIICFDVGRRGIICGGTNVVVDLDVVSNGEGDSRRGGGGTDGGAGGRWILEEKRSVPWKSFKVTLNTRREIQLLFILSK
jgi:hypothetical protein